MKEIQLNGKHGNGKAVQVDDEDYEYLKNEPWYITIRPKQIAYPRTSRWNKEKRKSIPIMMHRIIMNVNDPKIQIDHIDRNPLNNQKSNLRIVTASQNQANRAKSNRSDVSKYIGVKKTIYKDRVYWRAVYRGDGKFKSISCKSEVEAALQYNEMVKARMGEYAVINIIN